jgi:exonuclease SbcC
MQADYGTFLEADKSARMGVLSDILGLSFYERLYHETAAEAAEISRKIAELQNEKETLLGEELDINVLTEEFARLQQTETALAGKKKVYDELKAKITADIKALETNLDRISLLNADIRDLTQSSDAKSQVSENLTRELAELNASLTGAAGLEQAHNAYLAAVEREKFLVHQEDLQCLYLEAKAKSEKELAEVSETISGVQKQIAELEQECSESNLEKLRADVAAHKTITLELEEIKSKETELQNLKNASAMRYQKFQTQQAAFGAECRAINESINRLETEIERLKNSGCIDYGKADCEFIKAAKDAPDEIEMLQRSHSIKMAAYNAEINASKAETDGYAAQINIIAKYLSEKQPGKDALAAELERLSTASTELTKAEAGGERLAQYKTQLADLTARKQSRVTAVHDAQAALEAIRLSFVGDNINTALKIIRTDIETLAPKSGLWLQMPVIREKTKNAENLLAETNAEIKALQKTLEEKQTLLSALFTAETPDAGAVMQSLNENRESLESLDGYIRQNDGDIKSNAREQGVLETKLNRAKAVQTRVSDISVSLSDLSKLDACYHMLKLAFSKTGITHNIIRRIIPELEMTAGQILGAMTGNVLSVKFILDKTLKTKKEIITLDVVITDNRPDGTGALPYLSRSGGEKVKAALAVILALAELKASQNGTQLGFLFIDEPPFLDSDGVNAYCDALDVICRRYPELKLMAVTHDEEMKTRFPQNVFVYKDANGSRFTPML